MCLPLSLSDLRRGLSVTGSFSSVWAAGQWVLRICLSSRPPPPSAAEVMARIGSHAWFSLECWSLKCKLESYTHRALATESCPQLLLTPPPLTPLPKKSCQSHKITTQNMVLYRSVGKRFWPRTWRSQALFFYLGVIVSCGIRCVWQF